MQNAKSLLELITSGSVDFFVGLFLGVIAGYLLCLVLDFKKTKQARKIFDSVMAQKQKDYDLLLAEKRESLAEKDKSYHQMLAEKDKSYHQMLAEKDKLIAQLQNQIQIITKSDAMQAVMDKFFSNKKI